MTDLLPKGVPLTLEQAKELIPGTILNRSDASKNADGTPARFKVTSVYTRKCDPGRIRIRVKRGLREHYTWDKATFDYCEIVIQK